MDRKKIIAAVALVMVIAGVASAENRRKHLPHVEGTFTTTVTYTNSTVKSSLDSVVVNPESGTVDCTVTISLITASTNTNTYELGKGTATNLSSVVVYPRGSVLLDKDDQIKIDCTATNSMKYLIQTIRAR